MNLIDAIFTGAKALLNQVVTISRTIISEVLKEVDQSGFGRATPRLVDGLVNHFSHARDLAEEERELAKKSQKDGRRTEADAERLLSIEAERQRLRAELEQLNAERAAQEFRDRSEETLVTVLDDDELSANVGILAAKTCDCGGTMRIRQGGIDGKTRRRKFYWQCTAASRRPCPTIKLNPEREPVSIVRPADPDFDTPKLERRAEWSQPDVMAETHGRVRQHLGYEDMQVICPHHLLPMKFLPKRTQGGLLNDSYEYVCLGVTPDGRACEHTQSLETMPQVAAMLRRSEGQGIIRA